MTLNDPRVRALLLDIEGTTTPVEFVSQVLFPYARDHVREFLERHGDEDGVRADLAGLREQREADGGRGLGPAAPTDETSTAPWDAVVAYVHWLIALDRKATALKSLQGKIWEAGYREGRLRSEVYPDVPPALARWRGQGRRSDIYSSGSILAQRLLFAHTTDGDLTGWLDAYFDTTSGAKSEAASYGRIAAALTLPPSAVLFLSDTPAELDAARTAGLPTALCRRSGPGTGSPTASGSEHPVIRTFDDVFPQRGGGRGCGKP